MHYLAILPHGFRQKIVSVIVIIPLSNISANIKICPVGLASKMKYKKL